MVLTNVSCKHLGLTIMEMLSIELQVMIYHFENELLIH